MKRLPVQAISALLMNPYIPGFLRGEIYTGGLKAVCAPGLNCYSCPGALYACPIGSLQAVLNIPGALHSISAGRPEGIILFYVLGFMFVIGALVGRLMCGWACPFGWVQDLLFKIPTKKYGVPGGWKFAKYAVLLVFVIILPLFLVPAGGASPGDPWFCKIVCPAGTLEAGVPMVGYDKALRAEPVFVTGFLFYFKMSLLAAFLVWMVFVSRPFCRAVCPLGAIWGLFNKVSIYKMNVNRGRCIECGACRDACPTQVEIYKDATDANCIRCLECVPVCPQHCINEKASAESVVVKK